MTDTTGRHAQATPRPEPPPGASEVLDLPEHLFHRDALALAEESAGIGVWSIDLTTGHVRGTTQFFRIMGLAPPSGPVPVETLRALRHPDDRDRVLAGFRRALEDGTDAYEMEYRIIRPDGALRWIFGRGRVVRDARGAPVRYSGVDLDITDRKAAQAELAAAKEALERMNQALEERVRERTAELKAEAERRAQAEARLHQAQKMEAVGQLTGGLAHDFNNILQVIVGNLDIAAQLLQRADAQTCSGRPQEQLLAAIATAQKASQSARDLVHRMLAFSRLQHLSPTILNVNALIGGMRDMIARTLGETIRVTVDRAPDLWTTLADRNQLETALLNLVVNARDAMPQGGRLTIDTANAVIGEDHPGGIPRGRYVTLGVGDTGCGIPPELLGKVFEPFFTTKDTGKGSGLGLSMVYGFVTQSGGHVRISSELRAGTCVRIYLPRAQRERDGAERARDEARAEEAGDPGDGALPRARPGETILVVEDNDDVRRFGVAALEQLGYRVLEASDAHEALRMLDSAAPDRIDLLFTDVVLPGGISGTELADAIRARRPGVVALYTSGYAGGSLADPRELVSDGRFLAKPFHIERLAAAVRRCIDARHAAGTAPAG